MQRLRTQRLRWPHAHPAQHSTWQPWGPGIQAWGSRPTIKVHNAPGLLWVQLVQLLHLLWGQHLILRGGWGAPRARGFHAAEARGQFAPHVAQHEARVRHLPGQKHVVKGLLGDRGDGPAPQPLFQAASAQGSPAFSLSSRALPALMPAIVPDPHLRRRHEQGRQVCETRQSAAAVPVVAHQEVERPASEWRGKG